MMNIFRAAQSLSSQSTSQPLATAQWRKVRVAGFAIAAAAAVLWLGAPAARAQSTLTVNTLADSNDGGCSTTCSLRDAITQANTDNSGDTITFNVTGTITLTSALPGISSTDLTIQGPGANMLTISGAGQFPILWNSASGLSEWVISGLRFANGVQSGNGGAISGSVVSVNNCSFTSNSATGTGGAIYGEVMVDQSTFRGNSAALGGAIGSPVDVTVTDSTFSMNTSSGAGGAIGAFTVSATNDTFVGNTAGSNGGAIDATDDIAASNDVFSGNTATTAGGALAGLSPGVVPSSSVFWGNTPSDCSGCSSAPADASSNPVSLPLANWGGTTFTYLPQPGSAAICAGNLHSAYDAGVVNDERGLPFGSCLDAGAVQSNYVKVQSAGDAGTGAGDCPGASCTLRDAIAAATDGDIYFANGVAGTSLNPSSGTLTPNGSVGALNVIGQGALETTIGGNGSSGNQLSVLTVSSGQTLALYGLTVSGGYSASGAGINAGSGSTLSVLSSAVNSNTGGGIYNGGQSTIIGSTVSGNSASNGAGIDNAGTMSISESAVYGNTVPSSVSTGSGAGILNSGTLTVTGSTIANNTDSATSSSTGGGIETGGGTLTLNNAIVSGNSAITNSNIDGSYSGTGDTVGGETNATNTALNGTGATISLTSLPYNIGGMMNATLIPTPGDPAICAGLASNIPSTISTDQRGGPIENTTYPGYSPSTPCVDSGAVQTNYAITFTTEPQANILEYYAFSPAPVVGLTESGVPFGASTGTVTVTDSSTYLGPVYLTSGPSGGTTETLASGSATFGSVAVDLQPTTGPESFSNDILTATLPLDSLVSVTAESSDVQVNPEIAATLTAEYPGTSSFVTPSAPITNGTEFCWNNGTGPTQFVFFLGTIAQGENDVYSSAFTTATCATPPNIPQDGVTLFATLRQFIWGSYQNFYYTLQEGGSTTPATLTASTSGTTTINGTTLPLLTTPNATFSWSNGAGPSQYELWLGTAANASNLYNSGIQPYTVTQEVVPIASNGIEIFATLRQRINGAWQNTGYTYAEPGGATPATLTATTSTGTASSGQLTSPSATFYWNNGAGAVEFKVLIGTEGQGSSNLYASGTTTKTSTTVSVPAGGVTVWAQLQQEINGVWGSPVYYTFSEPGTEVNATLTTVAPPGSPSITLTSPTTTFYWNNGNGPSEYLLLVGTTGQGSSNVYKGTVATNTATLNATVNIPNNGTNMNIEFGQMVNGVWQYSYYVMAAPGSPTYASLSTSPTTQTTNLTSPDTTFYFINGNGPTEYYLYLGTGTSGSSQYNIYKGSASANTQVSVTTIPNDGVTIYATLFELFNGTWTPVSSTLTAPGSPTYAQLSPASGASLSRSQRFSWTGGVGISGYQLLLGTTGPGSSDIYNGPQTTATSVTVSIPANRATVYATLVEEFNGTWTTIDNYTYTEP